MKSFQVKNGLWNFIKKLANLNLSIFILFLIAIFSILGSIIEQDQSLSYYQINYPLSNSKLSFINWKLINSLGLDHIFYTWWFMSILLIFIMTLLSCTFFTQLPSLKNARRWKFIYSISSQAEKFAFEESYKLVNNSVIVMTYSLLRSNFFIFCQNRSLYGYKGLYGRISPIFVHFSIVTVLAGSILSFLFGFVAQEIVPNGEVFHIRHIVNSGPFSTLPSNIFVRVENFHLDYNFDGSIKQFISNISLLSNNNRKITSRVISVNHPLHYHNLTFYQTDWQLNALKINLSNGIILQAKLIKTNLNGKNCWLCSIPLGQDKQVFFVLFNLNDPIICLLYTSPSPRDQRGSRMPSSA